MTRSTSSSTTGGLTAGLETAVRTARAAAGHDGRLHAGASLAMAPAMLLTPFARFVDLDRPLLLARTATPARWRMAFAALAGSALGLKPPRQPDDHEIRPATAAPSAAKAAPPQAP